MQKNNILVVANIFFNDDHVFQFFNSIERSYIDYVILENSSKNSGKIEDFFKNKKILNHFRSEENITHGTVDYFLKNYQELINSYNYLILTDGDILVYDIDSYLQEAKSILQRPEVYVCAITLDLENLPRQYHPESPGWIPSGPVIDNTYVRAPTGTHMLVIKKQHFHILFQMDRMIDSEFHSKICENGGTWARTILNKGKHLTWDYYYPGNEYYEWKIANQWVQRLHDKKSRINIIK